MKLLRPPFSPVTLSIVWLFAFAAGHGVFGETASNANANALLEEARKSEFDRRMAAKETEAARLSEDLKRRKQEIDELDKSIYKVGGAATEAAGQLDKLGAEKKRLTEDLELINLRIEAEKLKAEGLMQLGIAHAKSRDALTKRTEEIDLRAAIVAAEIRQLSGKPAPEKPAPIAKGPGRTSGKATASKGTPVVSDLRTQLLKAEQATATAASNARLAMDAASRKLEQAEAAAAKAEKKAADIALEKNPSFPGGNDPLGAANP
jgi:hypothetical protein